MLGIIVSSAVFAQPVLQSASDSLRSQYVALTGDLAHSAFLQPLVIRSDEMQGRAYGEVFTVLDFPQAQVSAALIDPSRWCDLLVLHINTKYCRQVGNTLDPVLSVYIGTKSPQSLSAAQRVDFHFHELIRTPEYFKVSLDAPQGPMGTSQYAIVVESVGVSVNTSFVHLRYSYSINLIGRLAVNSYLATVGKDKVGFSKMEGPGEIAKRAYVQGVRGMVERNSMRYYLAILAHLHARSLPESARMQSALEHWFAATERFPAQLHESSRADYLAMKLDEIARQRALP